MGRPSVLFPIAGSVECLENVLVSEMKSSRLGLESLNKMERLDLVSVSCLRLTVLWASLRISPFIIFRCFQCRR